MSWHNPNDDKGIDSLVVLTKVPRDLYILSIAALQAEPFENQLSYFQVGGKLNPFTAILSPCSVVSFSNISKQEYMGSHT